MRARAAVTVEADGRGGVRLTRLRSAPPLVLRWTIDGLVLVAGAGGPLGGDDLGLLVEVGAGASLAVRSAAATLVQPGPAPGEPSAVAVTARVGEAGALRWTPEPTVIADSAVLHSSVHLDCAVGGSIVWRDVVVLGRREGSPGSLVGRLTADFGGEPLLRQETAVGPSAPPGWDGPAVTAGHRVLGTLLLIGASLPGRSLASARPQARWRTDGAVAAGLRLEGRGFLVTALGATTLDVLHILASVEGALLTTDPDPIERRRR